MTAAWRLLRSLLHLLRGYWIIRNRFSTLDEQARNQEVQLWSAQLLELMGIELRVIGQPIQRGMLICNHLSWLDNVAIHSAHFCRFVAKSDIQTWPVIGYLTSQSGMLFIQRTNKRDAHRVVDQIAESLCAGSCIAVFPEGTTGDGVQLLPFHATMFEGAIEANAIIQAVAIRYINARTGQPANAPIFMGSDTLLHSVWRTLNADELVAVIEFGEIQTAQGHDRRALAQGMRHRIHKMLA